jgi:hypothetical protein
MRGMSTEHEHEHEADTRTQDTDDDDHTPHEWAPGWGWALGSCP